MLVEHCHKTCMHFGCKVVDELVALLKTGCSSGLPDWPQLSHVFSAVYDVLYAYTKGDSRKNELYFAKHYFFFQQQLALQVCLYYYDQIKWRQ
jgi:hypothetical protein